MQNVKVTWTLPTTRESGLPLKIEDIANVRLELSADEGDTFAVFGDYAPQPSEVVIPDLEPGTWVVRGSVVDSKGRVSKPVVAAITLDDATAPGALLALDLSAA